MRRNFLNTFLTLLFGIFFSTVFSQSADPVLLQIGNEKITKNDFLKVFEKNNLKGEKLDAKAIEEYLEMYTNFRLKVIEAKSLGMDTAASFVTELAGYRKQLAQPYLVDTQMVDKMMEEAYDRKRFDIHASHILVRVDRLASAADTLKAWNKIMALQKRILKGEDFGKVAFDASEDQSAKDSENDGQKSRGNRGDLGFFSVFDMVYPFETAAYKAKLNEVTMPVRTDFGYHLLKVTGKTPAMGKVQLAHIILAYPVKGSLDDSLKIADSANMAFKALQAGADFGDIAKKFSDDLSTSGKGGMLPWFSINRLLPDFVLNIQKMKQNGDYSEPFQTMYGWHIIKLVDQKPTGSFEEEKEEIKQRISRSDWNAELQKAFVHRVKSNYGFTQNVPALDELIKTVTDSIFDASWKINQSAGLENNIFTIGTRSYTQGDFARYLTSTQSHGPKQDIGAYVNQKYEMFISDAVNQYADRQLDNEYPEFKSLYNEYHDGILLFDLTDKKVWSKAVKDTVGLQQYYDLHKNNYLWEPRLDASVFTIADASTIKSLKKLLKKGIPEDKILSKFTIDSIQKVTIDHRKFSRGENTYIDKLEWKPGISEMLSDSANTKIIVKVHALVAPEPKALNDIRGAITSDYQNALEKEWIASLRAKYPVVVNRDELNSLIK